jgi:hypothetical protein
LILRLCLFLLPTPPSQTLQLNPFSSTTTTASASPPPVRHAALLESLQSTNIPLHSLLVSAYPFRSSFFGPTSHFLVVERSPKRWWPS